MTAPAASRPPPHATRGSRALGWLRRNLLSSPLNVGLTLASVLIVYFAGSAAFQWLVIDAQWQGDGPEACPDKNAACWPFIRARFDQFMYGLYPAEQRWRVNLGIGLGLAMAVPMFLDKFRHKGRLALALLLAYPTIGLVLLRGGYFGLPAIGTSLWGGFFLTIVAAVFVLSTALPLALVLALGRQSEAPLVRSVCGIWIELWRSVPALVLLFVAIVMFPLFMPPGLEIDKLLRALIALTVLMSAYLSEAIRGALQSIPKGQYEAANALGMSYWQRTRLVVLPQALPVALPQITSNFIGLFKETTVLLIIGLFDLLGMVQTAASDPQWLSVGTSATGYVFAALFFWVFCFSFSRYTAYLERKTGQGQRRLGL
jgi:general L-amino acid transport system permease protein